MKKKFALIHSILAIAVLFSMLFQSLHSIEHLAQQLSEKKCYHKHSSSEEITHQHHNFEHCLVCEFTFCSCISSDSYCNQFLLTSAGFHYFSKLSNTVISFSVSANLLRGPPQFMF